MANGMDVMREFRYRQSPRPPSPEGGSMDGRGVRIHREERLRMMQEMGKPMEVQYRR